MVDIQDELLLSPLLSQEQENITREELQLVPEDTGCLLHTVLTAAECQRIRSSLQQRLVPLETNKRDYRNCERLEVKDPVLADCLWERVREWLPPVLEVDEDRWPAGVERGWGIAGRWRVTGLNTYFRLCRYEPGGHFAPHFDGYYQPDLNNRSFQTFMVYLNDHGEFTGGSTNFVRGGQRLWKDPDKNIYRAEDSNIYHSVQPRAGTAIVFNHAILHEGEQVHSGEKWILRTEVMYEREEPRSEEDGEALQMYLTAQRLESDGEHMEAMHMYRKAFKLCPELEGR